MKLDESITLDIDVDCDEALANASSAEIVDLAGILGLHSLMNQEQYHEIQSEKWDSKSDRNVAWNGVTKATPTRHVTWLLSLMIIIMRLYFHQVKPILVRRRCSKSNGSG